MDKRNAKKALKPLSGIALKPCPFCGCDAELEHYQGDGYLPQCTSGSCWGMIEKWFETPEQAAEAWNKRIKED